jgi:hypothetical protein
MSRRRLVALALAVAFLGDAAPPPARSGEPSPEYRAGLRRTLELRRQRRRRDAAQPVGLIVPFPLPPSLIIRQTPEVHDEISDLLFLLRYSGR